MMASDVNEIVELFMLQNGHLKFFENTNILLKVESDHTRTVDIKNMTSDCFMEIFIIIW